MKFTVTFKTPDALDQLNSEHMQPCAKHLAEDEWGHEDCDDCVEADEAEKEKLQSMKEFAEQYIEYGEYVNIEFDTDTQTAIVQKVG